MVSAFSCMREGVQAIEERGCTVLRCGHVREMHEVGSGVVIGNGGSLGGVLGVAAVASSVAMPSVYGWSMYGWLGGKHSIYIYTSSATRGSGAQAAASHQARNKRNFWRSTRAYSSGSARRWRRGGGVS